MAKSLTVSKTAVSTEEDWNNMLAASEKRLICKFLFDIPRLLCTFFFMPFSLVQITVVLDCHQDWCGPCAALDPILTRYFMVCYVFLPTISISVSLDSYQRKMMLLTLI